MAREDKRRGRPDKHKSNPRSWRPDEPTYADALSAATEVTGSLNAYLRLSVAYLLGLRRDPPPRPEWAERRAASLPDEPGSRPDNGTKD
jgi:hypothetical protein